VAAEGEGDQDQGTFLPADGALVAAVTTEVAGCPHQLGMGVAHVPPAQPAAVELVDGVAPDEGVIDLPSRSPRRTRRQAERARRRVRGSRSHAHRRRGYRVR
jgi:hypothetical protein